MGGEQDSKKVMRFDYFVQQIAFFPYVTHVVGQESFQGMMLPRFHPPLAPPMIGRGLLTYSNFAVTLPC